MTRTNLFSGSERRNAHARGGTAALRAGASSARAKSLTAALLLTSLFLLLSLSNITPTARADQVPAGSGTYYHLGDNLFANGTNALNTTNYPTVDGNLSSSTTIYTDSGNGGSFSGSCITTVGANVTLNVGSQPVDAISYKLGWTYSSAGGFGNCVMAGFTYSDGSTVTVYGPTSVPFGQTTTTQGWINHTGLVGVTNVWMRTGVSGCNCAGITKTAQVYDIAGYNKNSTTSDAILNIGILLAANTQCFTTHAAFTNFASNGFTLPSGTSYVMVPSDMFASGMTDVMQVFSTFPGVTNAFYASTPAIPDITGSHFDSVAIWKVTTTQPGLQAFIKPSANNVGSTDQVCKIGRPDDAYSSTLSNGYVTAPLTTWGGTANDLWGIVYQANAYPVNPVYDTDLNGQSPSLFALDNMTIGSQLFSTGTVGSSTTVSVGALPLGTREGNAFLMAVGQASAANGTSTSYQILVNGAPATVLANSGVNARGFQYALFYVDDVAGRNGLNESGGNVGQSGLRPLGGESYQISLAGGFDATQPVYAGNTYGLTGHAGITCLTLCGSNMFDYVATLPSQNANAVTFQVLNGTSGAPVVGARVVNTNTTTPVLTNAAGWANFSNVFTPTHFTISAPSYAPTCADFYYKSQSIPVNGPSDSLGCGYVVGSSASFNVLLGTSVSVTGNGGTATIGGATAVQITFNVTNPTFATGQLVQVTVNRSVGVDVWVVLYELDGAGNPQRAGGFTPYDWTPSQANSLPVTWPDGRVLNDADAGNYVLTVSAKSSTAGNGTLLAYDPIGVNVAAAPTVGTSLLTNLNTAAQNDINRQSQVNSLVNGGAISEATVQQDFLTWLDWFPRTDLLLPNAVLYPALFMLGALMLRFGRQSWGR